MGTTRPIVAVVFALYAAMAGSLHAGPLDPPPGPITGTLKPLSDVEPRTAINAVNTPGDADSAFKITQPGSYYLAGNLTGEPGKHGIEIAVGDVTIDLMGFAVRGVPKSLTGVMQTSDNARGIVVRNGTFRGWDAHGIDMLTANSGNCAIESVRVYGSGQCGIRLGHTSTISSCSAALCNGTGIVIGANCTMRACTSADNSIHGFETGDRCTVSECTASNNDNFGLDIGSSCTLTQCAAGENGYSGFLVNTECVLTGCVASLHGYAGFEAQAGCTFVACTAGSNTGQGFFLLGDACSARMCTSKSNGLNGFWAGEADCQLVECLAVDNRVGIEVGVRARVECCTATTNNNDGIRASSKCLIRNNTSHQNGMVGVGSGITVLLNDNHIEGNTCSGTDRGILVNAAGNIIVRNTCTANTINWIIASNNVFGPILDRTAPESAAVSGNAASSSLGTTDGNANFTY